MKKLTENITSSEKFYLLSVEKLNHEWYILYHLGILLEKNLLKLAIP
jgi:hypothetical protein